MASDLPATVADPVVEQPAIPVAERPAEAATEQASVNRRPLIVASFVWAICGVGLVAFIAFARVPLEAGWRQDRSMRVLDIWSLFVAELTTVAGPLVTPGLITGVVILFLAGSLLCLWLALNVTSDAPPDEPDVQ